MSIIVAYGRVHAVLGEGDFVLKIAEHWDTIGAIPMESEWSISNGKFGFFAA